MSCGNGPGNTAEEGEVLMPKRRILPRTDPKSCFRCHTARGAFILRSQPHCKDCFFPSVQLRFTRRIYQPLRPPTVRKNVTRPPIQDGQVLVALSGGAGSMAMLDQMTDLGLIGSGDGARADKTKGEKEVVWESGTVVYVEFAWVTGMSARMEEMEEVAKSQGLGFVGVRAEDVYDEGLERRLRGKCGQGQSSGLHGSSSSSNTSQDNLTRLRTLLSSLPPTSRPSLLQLILDHLLTLVAHSLPNVSQLLLGETSTREAQRVISATASGRGWALPLELANTLSLRPSSTVDPSPIIRLKPMKDISLKEAAVYCHLRRLPTVNQRRWVDGRSSGGRGKGSTSLEMLTEQFILGLSVTHPSTVSTINKTGDKLVFSGNAQSAELCPLCQMPAEPSAQAWKSRTALTSLPDKTEPIHRAEPVVPEQQDSTLEPLLCYACLTTLTPHTHTAKKPPAEDGETEAELPLWVEQRARHRRVGPEEMRKDIQEFLL